MTLTLDTSGAVPVRVTPTSHQNVGWIDLTPFTQGYVEAAFASAYHDGQFATAMKARRRDMRLPGFSDLSPDTLAAMMADCEAFQTAWPTWRSSDDGLTCWHYRQHPAEDVFCSPATDAAAALGPLTLYISEDGLIHHREAS